MSDLHDSDDDIDSNDYVEVRKQKKVLNERDDNDDDDGETNGKRL